jgi:hypothetical protein
LVVDDKSIGARVDDKGEAVGVGHEAVRLGSKERIGENNCWGGVVVAGSLRGSDGVVYNGFDIALLAMNVQRGLPLKSMA